MLKIDLADITIVFQGNLDKSTPSVVGSFSDFVRKTENAFPKAFIIFSTWNDVEIPEDIPIDLIIRSIDPGPLPSIRFDDKSNNINRQIVTTHAGLSAVKTKYAIKLRADSYLEHARFLEYYSQFSLNNNASEHRIVSSSFFTIDPSLFEHIPFHISDWFQFGETKTLLSYWDVELMSVAVATHYESHAYKAKSTFLEKKFRGKYAVEQYMAMSYAKKLGYPIPNFHNDNSTINLKAHKDFIANNFIILDPWQIGLCLPKYKSTYTSKFQWLKCTMFVDWYFLYVTICSPASFDQRILKVAKERSKKKKKAHIISRLASPFDRLLYSWRFRKLAFKLLNILSGEF